MRPILLRGLFGAIVVFAPAAGEAAVSLAPIMESWSHSERDIGAMLSGQTPYDETQVRIDLQRYIASSRFFDREIKGGSAGARDFKTRFEAFADDSQRALDKVGQPSTVATNFNRMLADCQFCHVIYDN